ncbi:hypothetical protein J2S07_002869 [Robertmurraya andreesenii]|uniref:Uncharacterized protein n=1 Tax=Anoxybacillus andreesenii TaxID=1325932 RepID=A0ABT9V6H3_9BACL|nr:hypothetical protein [Robertmurraya andreesenii]
MLREVIHAILHALTRSSRQLSVPEVDALLVKKFPFPSLHFI